jgi:NAD(P)-dependent dehydrogenase (short-subunit alcohol dehydrogenase family)
MEWKRPDLAGQVALVTGSSRGVGRGIALALGQCGATVYVTGRSSGASATDGLAGTVESTAREVTEAGGKGVPMVCDHTRDADLERVVARLRRDGSRLDLLVNNAWAGYERYGEVGFSAPFWEQPLWRWDAMLGSVRAHFAASRACVPLMLPRKAGLVVTVGFDPRRFYLGNVPYDTAKAAKDRMAWGMALELRAHGIASLSLTPGFVRTERVEAVTGGKGLEGTQSPFYAGRAVAHLAGDSNSLAWTGRNLDVGDLARRYGFTDIDGTQPEPFMPGPKDLLYHDKPV